MDNKLVAKLDNLYILGKINELQGYIKKLLTKGEAGLNVIRNLKAINNSDLAFTLEDAKCIYGKNLIHYILQGNAILTKEEIKIYQDEVIASGHGSHIVMFAKNVAFANIAELEDAICQSQSGEHIYDFALRVNGANIEKLEDAICKTNDGLHICCFAKNVKGANIDRLYKAVCEIGDKDYVNFFNREVLQDGKSAQTIDEMIDELPDGTASV